MRSISSYKCFCCSVVLVLGGVRGGRSMLGVGSHLSCVLCFNFVILGVPLQPPMTHKENFVPNMSIRQDLQYSTKFCS